MERSMIAVCTPEQNPNHHLWLNNGTWFVHYTIYPTPITKERVRRSLKTKSIEEARQRRDALFRELLSPVAGPGTDAELSLAA